MAGRYRYGLRFTDRNRSRFNAQLGFTPASFVLDLSGPTSGNFQRRYGSHDDVIVGWWQGTTPEPGFRTLDGDTGFPLDWFEDGTPAAEAVLRFFEVTESGYFAARFGRTAKNSQNQELIGPNLRLASRRLANWVYQHGNIVFYLGAIISPQDPYFTEVGPRLGLAAEAMMPATLPRRLYVAAGQLLERPDATETFTHDQLAWDLSTSQSYFNVFFPDRAHTPEHSEYRWRALNGLSTPTTQSGPSADTNTSPFYYVEVSGSDGAAQPRIHEAGRTFNPILLPGTNRQLELEFSLAGTAFRAPFSGLYVLQYDDPDAPNIDDPRNVSQADQSTHFRGWSYLPNYAAGQTVNGFGNGNTFTTSTAGGWRTETVQIADSTNKIQLMPAWENHVTNAPIALGDVCIRNIRFTGNVLPIIP